MTSNLAVYIHWPWCESKCPYCDFNSHVSKDSLEELAEEYLAALLIDLDFQYEQTGPRKIDAIFFGGGTPSLMPESILNQIIEFIGKKYAFTNSIEVTTEANPASSDLKRLINFKNSGVNRISLGVQSFDDKILQFLGRKHTAATAQKVLEQLFENFKNVSADFIYGIPDQNLTNWMNDLEKVSEYPLSHLSCYQLTIEPQTKFFSDVRSGKWGPITSDTQADFFECTRETLISQGWENYETSNFAKNRQKCRYNTRTWEYGDFIGLGAGAHGRFHAQNIDGKVKHIRTQHIKHPLKYMAQMQQTPRPATFCATSNAERYTDTLFCGLRLAEGISLKNILQISNIPTIIHKKFLDEAKKSSLCKLGYLEINLTHIRLTERGWSFLDTITAELIDVFNKVTENTVQTKV